MAGVRSPTGGRLVRVASLHLRVPRSTGTAGDDLVAWGLAVFASEVLKIRVTLRAQGDSFEIDGRYNGSLDEHLASVEADRIKLRCLSSTGKNRFPPAGSAVASVDRDVLRDAFAQLRAAGPSRPMGGDAPALTASAPAQQYPLYKALTAPGTQWGGYNKLVEHVEKLWTPLGLGLVLRYFDRDNPLPPDSVDSGLKSLGLRGREDRWRNPPGFLYPGLNKGPTMRIAGGNDRWIGPASHLDWLQVDRYDRNIIELYLAYVGYFAVARVLDYKEGRTVAVPAPSFVEVPDILDRLRDVTLRASTIQAYLAGQASLRYAAATVDYLADHRVDDSDDADSETWILAGVHLAHYWKPNQFKFAAPPAEQ